MFLPDPDEQETDNTWETDEDDDATNVGTEIHSTGGHIIICRGLIRLSMLSPTIIYEIKPGWVLVSLGLKESWERLKSVVHSSPPKKKIYQIIIWYIFFLEERNALQISISPKIL